MSRTIRNTDPFYTTHAAKCQMLPETIAWRTDKRDGKATNFVDAGAGIVVQDPGAKKFFKRQSSKKARRGIQVLVFNAIMDAMQERQEEEAELNELYERIAEIEEAEALRWASEGDDFGDDDWRDNAINDPYDYGDDIGPWCGYGAYDPFDDFYMAA